MAHFFGDVLRVTLTFSDVSNAKRHPVLVIFDSGDAVLLVSPITSHKSRTADDVALQGWQAAGLRLPSTVRMAKLATVSKATLIRRLGHLDERDLQQTRKTLDAFLQRIGGAIQ